MFGSNGAGGGSWWIILVYIGLFAVLYFLLIRPNSKKKKQEQEMRNNIAIGDDITTIGGIQGRIIAVKEDEDAFVIETGPDRTKMKFKKWAISSVDTVKDTPAATTKEDKLKALQEKRQAKKAAKQAAKEEKEAAKNNEK
ncbi:preprotein translocase subunit YajC [Ruminococcus sp.]|uniref:preprotein translocase subunit YajC n=1 Tax=Ruminococcus sp. TaxID=41978 RepID=UPI00388FDC91